MTAKCYLKQIELMNTNINEKIERLNELKTMASCTGALSNSERVKSSGSQDKMANEVTKIVDMERTIDKMIDQLVDYKAKVEKIINNIEDERLKDVLIGRYFRFDTYEKIAADMHMTRSGAYKLHNRAIREFEKIYTQYIV